ncbi:MAG TPA: MlaD family protein [Bryobacteraceae bacterium]|jgi:phospholipid/cholesterol/gamma-HCH transport system substrate-binding protein|nr:MlaD family protein [Bryobacteraceae bacterium]
MASKEKVSMAQLKVGILGIVALFFVFLLVFLLTGNTNYFAKQMPLHTYTADASALTTGAPVRINGILAGKVGSIALSGSNDPNKIVKIDFDVDEGKLKDIPVDSVISIASDNLLGSSMYLNIKKGRSQETAKPGATLQSTPPLEINGFIARGNNVLDSVQAILAKIQDIVGEVEVGHGTIGKLLVDETLYKSLEDTVTQVQLLATTLNSRKGTIGMLVNDDQLYSEMKTLVSRVDTLTQGLQQGQGTAGMLLKDPKMYNDLDISIKQLNTILTNLNSGKGTAGLLLKDPKIANQISGTLDKIDLTMDKINSGRGTIGQLLTNPQLYDEATGTTHELHDLLKDFRANPKKFLRIQLHVF